MPKSIIRTGNAFILQFKSYHLTDSVKVFQHNVRTRDSKWVDPTRSDLNLYWQVEPNRKDIVTHLQESYLGRVAAWIGGGELAASLFVFALLEATIRHLRDHLVPADVRTFEERKQELERLADSGATELPPDFSFAPFARKDRTVFVHEWVVSASSPFFHSLIGRELVKREDYEEISRNPKLLEWVADNIRFFGKIYRYSTIIATLHLDEKVPHLHIMTAPLWFDSDRSRLYWSGKKFLGDRYSARYRFYEILTSYEEAVGQKYGLGRGLRQELTGRDKYNVPIQVVRKLTSAILAEIRQRLEQGEKIEDILGDERLYAGINKHMNYTAEITAQKNEELLREVRALRDENRRLKEALEEFLNARSAEELVTVQTKFATARAKQSETVEAVEDERVEETEAQTA
ncbi:plasmid recombination protein [Thermosulfurimonas sp. F29]|uniref:plasmid recombination protein n=1 Tax=Thermosulfurimonas sp. F29 TaxID=2867247 RepID=UPI001C840567|nr:plasmid recombination protein [Thermosulfurimonas sp. F29]MBX6423811.1 plasmid recombination protein [Thermosulfurimonas sp. F29]